MRRILVYEDGEPIDFGYATEPLSEGQALYDLLEWYGKASFEIPHTKGFDPIAPIICHVESLK